MSQVVGNPGLIAEHAKMHGLGHFSGLSMLPQFKRIEGLVRAHGIKTLIDWGCGGGQQYEHQLDGTRPVKDMLAAAGLEKICLYDPAVPKFAEVPTAPGDMVVSTDVLEHIEENDLDAAIEALFRLTTKVLFVSVACYPAKKMLPDGRNAHATVQPPEWWKAKFETHSARFPNVLWKLVCTKDHAGTTEVFGTAHAQTAKPFLVHSRNTVPEESIRENIKACQAAIIPWLRPARAHDRTALIIGGAPSMSALRPVLEDRLRQGDNPLILCVKSSHDLLLSWGITPTMCSLLDPRGHAKDYIERVNPDVVYLVASMVHPSLVHHLAGQRANMRLYHAAVGAQEHSVALGGLLVGGGTTSAMRGVKCLREMGFRRFEFFGLDSSYGEGDYGGAAHTKRQRDDHLWIKPTPIPVRDAVGLTLMAQMGGQKPVDPAGWFYTDPELVCQVQDLMGMLDEMRECQFTFHGGGLFPTVGRIITEQRAALPPLEEIL